MHGLQLGEGIVGGTRLDLRPIQLLLVVVEDAEQHPDIEDVATSILTQVEDHAVAVFVKVFKEVLQVALADVVHERGIADIGHLAITNGVMGKTTRCVVVDSQVVEHHDLGVDVTLGIHPIIHRVAVRHVEGRNQVGVAVFQGVEHGSAHTEEAVVIHVVVHLGKIDFVNRVPVDALHVEEGILLVDLVPKVFEHVDGVGGFVGGHEGALTRGKAQHKETKQEKLYFFHGDNQLSLNIKSTEMVWKALSKR